MGGTLRSLDSSLPEKQSGEHRQRDAHRGSGNPSSGHAIPFTRDPVERPIPGSRRNRPWRGWGRCGVCTTRSSDAKWQ